MDRILVIQFLFLGFLCGWTCAIAILGFEDIVKRNKKEDIKYGRINKI